jgi:hypothetical protein
MQQSTFFRRQAFQNIGGFNENNRTSWDGELLVDLALNGSHLAMIEDYWSLFAIYPGSVTSSAKHNQQFHAEHARMFRNITGREYHQANKLLFSLARAEKWLRNPLVPLYRVIDKSIGAPRLSVTSSCS